MDTKVAILIDGGFYTIRHKTLNNGKNPKKKDVEKLIEDIMRAVKAKTNGESNDVLLRSYYYDCMPFDKKVDNFNRTKTIDYSKSAIYKAMCGHLNQLNTIDRFALRLGELSFSGWKLDPYKPKAQPKPDFRQKGVDMKIGLDMAWMAGKKTINKIVLVTGDSDFIAPIKHVRKEGILVYLYPMGQKQLKQELIAHCDFVI